MNLQWGLRDVIPDDAAAAWGARAIATNKRLDTPPDRCETYIEDVFAADALQRWMHLDGFPWLHRLIKTIPGNDMTMHALDDGRFHIRANANASYGYLYISAWCDKEQS